MLKIQLCPESELENKQWWVLDAGVLALCAVVAWFGSTLILNFTRSEIDRLNKTAANWTLQTSEVQPSVQKFKGLDQEVELLKKKIEALKKINLSGLDKITPIVVVEQLQALNPDGVWYRTISLKENKSLEISGASKDSLLISEFLLGLRESMNPDTISTDVRTQIGFEEVKVKEIKDEEVDKIFEDVKSPLVFTATAVVKEKKKLPAIVSSLTVPAGRSKKKSFF